MTISYLQDNDYFAEITTDIQIEYPNMEINFTEDNKLTDYLYYTLISDIDIAFDKTDSSDDTKKTFIASSIYAGNNINLQNKANVEFDGTMLPMLPGIKYRQMKYPHPILIWWQEMISI